MKNRIKKCTEAIRNSRLDSLLISDPTNVSYLSGFRPAEGWLLITSAGEMFYLTNFLYQKEAEKVNLWKVIAGRENIFSLLEKTVKRLGIKKIGFEGKTLPFLEYKQLYERLSKANVSFSETIDLIENLRAQKTAEEISLIKKSIKVSKEAFEFSRDISEGVFTEKEFSIEIEKFLRLKGDNQIAFPPIVASGKNTSFPHYMSQDVQLNKKYFLIDLGAKYCGYCADLTRIFFWGKMPNLFKKIYDTVKKAKDQAIKKVKEGVRAKDIDRAAREIIDKRGWGKFFGHGLGHGVGLAVHEPPFLNCKNEEILKAGTVVTIEPAVYIDNKFGIRIEDMVLVNTYKGEILSGDIHK